jgi:two-component system, cell cycle sensor histidine kinase and response regulator CckA
VKEILAINPETKNVVFSGYYSNPVLANYKKYGFSGAMTKPYLLNELMKVLDPIFGNA